MADVGFEFGRDGRRAHAAVKHPNSVGLALEHINYGGVDALSGRDPLEQIRILGGGNVGACG